MNNLKPAERIVFNTMVLYGRLILVLILGLFTTRIVLDALGETDYGIYTLVAGVVGMLAVLQSAMSNTSMRYMSFSLGSGDEKLNSRTFNTTLFLHFIIGFFVLIFIEVGGFFMFKYLLEIPENKLTDAKVVFHLMALTTFVAIIAVPYDAVINSHENLFILSIVDILGAVLKLAVAIYLIYTSANVLILYGLGMFSVQLIMRMIKQQYSVKHYRECRLNFKKGVDKKLTKEIISFSGWNLLGSVASISVNQIRSVLLNIFFGVKVNASEGIAKNVRNQVNMVSVSLTRAINPQLVKSEGKGDRLRMLWITDVSTKFSIFLFLIIAIPVIIELPYLLSIWLKDVPEFAVIFGRLTIIGLLIDKFTFEITSAIRAVGKIRNFQIIETLVIILNLPVAYFLFKMSYPPQTIYLTGILFSLITSIYRLYFGKKITGLNIWLFIKQVIVPSIIPMMFATFIGILFNLILHQGFIRLLFSTLSMEISIILCVRYFGISQKELHIIKKIINSSKNGFSLWRRR